MTRHNDYSMIDGKKTEDDSKGVLRGLNGWGNRGGSFETKG